MLLNVQVEKDSATHISKEVTREEAEALAMRFSIKVATGDGLLSWAEFVEKYPVESGDDADQTPPDEKVVVASLLKRQGMNRAAFKKLAADVQDKMIVEETAAMAAEADIAAGKTGPVVGTNGSDVTSPD